MTTLQRRQCLNLDDETRIGYRPPGSAAEMPPSLPAPQNAVPVEILPDAPSDHIRLVDGGTKYEISPECAHHLLANTWTEPMIVSTPKSAALLGRMKAAMGLADELRHADPRKAARMSIDTVHFEALPEPPGPPPDKGG